MDRQKHIELWNMHIDRMVAIIEIYRDVGPFWRKKAYNECIELLEDARE
jgi:hypothetical protein